ncbi:hypothetical protein J14TS2_29870 [Bacillus sp. J14TS2]|uniref:ABC transporter substrate-binding protein n=1 Tax=Bacillus sp. J14TS2 TaxID=2807188 RepID=UPI001B2B6C71|nr:extracellular solute-binding protein [Bacillus sp. J14TS2]GIN72512.1 hypothetical protein J14TS2_29870 [Bacillus sp. J14TS2]
MQIRVSHWALLFGIIFSISIMVACSDSSTPSEGNEQKKEANDETQSEEEITIKWAYPWGEEGFNEEILKYVEAEFPNIKFEYLDGGPDHPETLENLIAAGNSPDILSMGQVNQISVLDNLGLAFKMDELIEKENFDLERFEPSIIEYARNRDPNREGGLYAIPNGRAVYSLHYNKDVFDILGVEYPQDGLTWDEVIDLARDLTREVNGVQYRGLDLDVPLDSMNVFSENTVDPETNEVLIADSEAVRRYLQMIDEVISIPGNYPAENPGDLLHNWGEAWGKGDVAMQPARTGWLDEENVDIATYPVWEGYEGLMPVANGGVYAISEPNEHKEASLKVIEYLMSDEIQMIKSKEGGHPSVLKNPEIHEVYGQDKPGYADKNLQSIFMYENATGPSSIPKYTDDVLWMAAVEFANSGKDVNEFMRILQEQAEANVRAQMEQE